MSVGKINAGDCVYHMEMEPPVRGNFGGTRCVHCVGMTPVKSSKGFDFVYVGTVT